MVSSQISGHSTDASGEVRVASRTDDAIVPLVKQDASSSMGVERTLPEDISAKVQMYATGALAPEFKISRATVHQALILGARLAIVVKRTPAIAGAEGGAIDIVVRLNSAKKLYVEVQPDSTLSAAIYDTDSGLEDLDVRDGASLMAFVRAFPIGA